MEIQGIGSTIFVIGIATVMLAFSFLMVVMAISMYKSDRDE